MEQLKKSIVLFFTFFVLVVQARSQEIIRDIREGNLEKIQASLESDTDLINKKYEGGWTLLHYASYFGQKDIVAVLIEQGAYVKGRDNSGWTSLHRAASAGHSEVIRFLVANGADVNSFSGGQDTPLSMAILGNFAKAVKTIIDCGGDVNVRLLNRETPLHHAAEFGNLEIIAALISHGAEINAKKNLGITPLHIAAAYGHRNAVELFVEKGADVNAKGDVVGTPLHQARAFGSEKIVSYMIVHGAENVQREFPVFKGPYLGMKRPKDLPESFAPGVVKNIQRWVRPPTFSPDGKEMYWSGGSPHGILEKIWFMKQKDGQWTPPQMAPFTTLYNGASPSFSYDGNKLFFHSNRPFEDGGIPENDLNVWVVERQDEGWKEPKCLGKLVNSDRPECFASANKDGTLYFQGTGQGITDIFQSRFINGSYTQSENLGAPVNSQSFDSTPCVAPDGSFIVFTSARSGRFELYVSFRRPDGSWTEAVNLGDKKNIKGNFPKLTMDGKFLFYILNDKVYWVSTEIILELNPLRYDFPCQVLNKQLKNPGSNIETFVALNTKCQKLKREEID